ncbi:MAG TPA: 5'-nucleotidase C-terminal domain-containing protein, partial [Gemmatimonadaceae bacterium]
ENVAARVARELPGIDLIVYGHSHKQMADTVINGVLMMQPTAWATSVGVAHPELRYEGTSWRVVRSWSSLVSARGHAESPAVLAVTARVHDATIAYVSAAIGRTALRWRGDSARVADTPLIDFVLDVERRAAHTDLASTAAFTLDAALDSGAITVAEVARLYPYDNTLKAIRISGTQLREYLEFSARYLGQFGTSEPPVDPRIPGCNFDIVSGATYTIDLARPVGSRIPALAVGGTPVSNADTFTLALNNYRQSGGGGYAMLRGAAVVYDGQVELRQLLIDAVKRHRDLDPSMVAHHNWSIIPAAAIGPAYAAMHRPFDAESAGTRRRVVPSHVRPEPPRIPVTVTPPARDTMAAKPTLHSGAGAGV